MVLETDRSPSAKGQSAQLFGRAFDESTSLIRKSSEGCEGVGGHAHEC